MHNGFFQMSSTPSILEMSLGSNATLQSRLEVRVNDPANKRSLSGKERLIVALDVPTHDEAVRLVRLLEDVSFFKIGLQLFLTGQVLDLIRTLREDRDGKVFLDIKWGGDIGNTAGEFKS